MNKNLLIHNAIIINEGIVKKGSVLIKGNVIEKIYDHSVPDEILISSNIIEAGEKYLIPGIIDSHVHFREPGLTYKGEISTESMAAIAGGVTSVMDMPNTKPQTITQQLLQDKFSIASEKSLVNYSFFIGATNDNLEELLKTDPGTVCGIKIFMGSSTGNMLVDNLQTLELIFKNASSLIAVHCEDEQIIQENTARYIKKYGTAISMAYHPLIRSEAACYKSTSMAVELGKKFGTRLHVLHLSTAKELELFDKYTLPKDKKITSEVCAHHLWFDENDHERFGTLIKCNPAIKTSYDKQKLMEALVNDTIDTIASDHAPHTREEKNNLYSMAPSGGPMVQHTLNVMLELHQQDKLSLTKIIQKMCHHPADIFNVHKRGYIREGYFADLSLIDLNKKWTVEEDNIYYKCKWSPFLGYTFTGKITHTFVNGNLVYENGMFIGQDKGIRLLFDR